MKRSLSILLAAALFAACGPKPEATVDGIVAGIADGTKVWLLDGQTPTDSTTVAGGKFRFEMAKAYPDLRILRFDGVAMPFSLFVEPGAIVAGVDNSDPAKPAATFGGTPTNDGRAELREETAGFDGRMEELGQVLMSTPGGTPAFDSLMAIVEGVVDERNRYVNDRIRSTPNTVFAAYMINSTAHSLTTPEMVDSVLNIVAGAPANAFSDQLKERRAALAATAVGVAAPDFTQAQPDGTPLSLSSLKGKLVLIDFWASWCGPCRAENPNVVKLYDRFKDKGFEILGVSLDDSREEWLKAIEQDGLGWRHVSDIAGWQNAVAGQYAVRSIPHTVLVGPDGVIIAKNLRGADLEAKVAEVLGE